MFGQRPRVFRLLGTEFYNPSARGWGFADEEKPFPEILEA